MKSLVRLRAQARGFSFLPKQPVRSLLSGKHASKIRGRGLDFEELRHYRIGDDIRTIDWKATNRTGKPQVRVYTEERERPVLLIVDQRISMFFGSKVKMKSVVAAELAALVAWRVLDAPDRVGGIIFNDNEIQTIRPERSQRNLMRLFGEIVRLNQALGRQGSNSPENNQLNAALTRAERLCSHDFLIILLSDFSGWNSESVKRIRRLARHNDVIASLVFDPLEKDLPSNRKFVASDGSKQIEVAPNLEHLAARFSKSFSTRSEAIESKLNRYGVPVIPIHTVTSAAAQVRQAIGKLESFR
ncbi:DUF58 domain-containing protein [Pelagicoccus mobilis]|uniref:DUF58 domain-containing protein n=1 Tax=Pelagicoccus mobilis TaxID=415221 RepID=A0A934VQV8_9BACT|nr:DUF58 domain-containing protein [Pelagicoccus mobilis]MBK1877310.1 DUF58 domain-containing protein [Pelagicoccus mobilis]